MRQVFDTKKYKEMTLPWFELSNEHWQWQRTERSPTRHNHFLKIMHNVVVKWLHQIFFYQFFISQSVKTERPITCMEVLKRMIWSNIWKWLWICISTLFLFSWFCLLPLLGWKVRQGSGAHYRALLCTAHLAFLSVLLTNPCLPRGPRPSGAFG